MLLGEVRDSSSGVIPGRLGTHPDPRIYVHEQQQHSTMPESFGKDQFGDPLLETIKKRKAVK